MKRQYLIIQKPSKLTQIMQKLMVKYSMGVRIVSVKLQDVNPPDAVKASFNDVNAAKQDQEKDIRYILFNIGF